jgi:hypothetical protein
MRSAPPAAGFPIRLISTAAAAPIVDELESLEHLGEELLKAAVPRSDGNLSAAALLPGITRPQLAYRLKKYDKGKYQDVPACAGAARFKCPDGQKMHCTPRTNREKGNDDQQDSQAQGRTARLLSARKAMR